MAVRRNSDEVMRRVTMRDVAREAGLSRATVSKVVNDDNSVSPSSVVKIREAMAKLNYRPNEMARSLMLQRTMTMGAIFPWVTDPWVARILETAQSRASEHDYRLMIYSGGDLRNSLPSFVEAAIAWRMDALISLLPLDRGLADQLAAHGIPAVSYADATPGVANVRYLTMDIDTAVLRIASHLIQLGHRRVVSLVVSEGLIRGDRTTRLKKAFARFGQDPELVVEVLADKTADGAASAVPLVLSSASGRPTAVVCGNDTMALGVLSGLDRAGVRVPQDVSVVGVNDDDFSRFTKPPLTTLRVSPEEVAIRMVDAAISLLRGEDVPVMHQIIPDLIVRESTGPAPSK